MFAFFGAFGQNTAPRVEISPDEIKADEKLEIRIFVVGSPYVVGEFPDIKGFKKENRTIKHSQIRINRKKEEQHQISQYYTPEVAGKVTIPAFEIMINQKSFQVEQKQLNILKEEEVYVEKNIEIEEVDFVVEVSKKKVFVGEGFMLNINFYLSDKTTTQWQFSDNIGNQVEQFAKKIKPNDCLESRLNISNLVGKKIMIKGESYTVYNLFEAIYYPLNAKGVSIPALELIMQKQKGSAYLDVSLKSKSQNVAVEKLPDHPLKEKVPVGVFRFIETLKAEKEQYAGNSFEYKLTVDGEGNFGGVNIAKPENNKQFEFFEINSVAKQNLGSINGNKTLLYKIIPKESGEFDLSSDFALIYFNTQKAKYDTLRSTKKVTVSGKSFFNNKEVKKDIYSDIENLKTDEKSYNLRELAKVFANFVVGFMVLVYFYILKSKNKG